MVAPLNGAKRLIKGHLGAAGINRLLRINAQANAVRYSLTPIRKRIDLESRCSLAFEISGSESYFRGYYDIDYMSRDGRALLCHRLPEKSYGKKNRDVSCEVGYYDIERARFVSIASTHAWCWQQGSRLRWHPSEDDVAMFNSTDDVGYMCELRRFDTGELVGILPMPLYDVSPDGAYGLSVNYSRLQRLRPGYGYDYFEDATSGRLAPDDDGLWYVDLGSGRCELAISLSQLAAGCEGLGEHYINHVSISPDSRRVMFFHIINEPDDARKVRLCTCSCDGSNLCILEDKMTASHYCWLDYARLIVTFYNAAAREVLYAVVDAESGDRTILGSDVLTRDGHPSILDDGEIVTDTYPDLFARQKLMTFRRRDSTIHTCIEMLHHPRLEGEYRCDLHPSVSRVHGIVTVDTVYAGRERRVLGLKISEP